MIKKPSFARFWARAPPRDDVDFVIYDSTNLTNPIAFGLGVEESESTVLKLEPQSHPFVWDFNVFSRASQGCAYFSAEVAIETFESLQAEYTCPTTPPRLPASVDINAGNLRPISRRPFNFIKSDFTNGL